MSDWHSRVLSVTRWEVTTWRTRRQRWIIPERWQATAQGYNADGVRVVILGQLFDTYAANTREAVEAWIHAAIRKEVADAKAEVEFQRAKSTEFTP